MTPRMKALISVACLFGVILLVPLILLDTYVRRGYTTLHPHQCFERLVKEPWETEPLGRIEQVGIKRVLVTMWAERKVTAMDAKVYGFSLSKDEFNREYKEIPCLPQK